MSAVLIRKFLLKMPRPSSIRMRVNDEQQLMTIPGNPHWGEIAESVDALEPTVIEVLDKNGGMLRVAKAEQFDDTLVEDKQASSRAAQNRVAFDAETARFIKVAELLADAHKFSEIAFDKLVGIVNSVTQNNERKDKFIDSMQRAYSRVLEENAELATSGADGNQDPMEMMAHLFFSGAMQAQQERKAAEAAAPKPTNGAAHPPPTTTKVRGRA